MLCIKIAVTAILVTAVSNTENQMNSSIDSGEKHTNSSTATELQALQISGPSPSDDPATATTTYYCPKGFTFHSHNNYPVCYILTEPQQFPPKCPYPHYLALNDLITTKLLDQFQGDVLWVMMTRSAGNVFGPFEWLDKDCKYQTPFNGYVRQHADISEKRCMVITNNVYIPVSCKDRYVALCAYPYHYKAINAYCKSHFEGMDGYLKCIPDSIDIENNKCYCEKGQAASFQTPSRDQFCSVLAEPVQTFQSVLMVTQLLTVHDVCWFGLYQAGPDKLKWTNSKEMVNYTFWASASIDHSKTLGAMSFVDPAGWLLKDEHAAINCAICELKNDYTKRVSVRLEFIHERNAVQVTTDNFLEVSDYFGRHDSLFCFAGPTTEDFKHSIIQRIPLGSQAKTSGENVMTRYIENAWEYPLYYWCEGFQRPNLKPIFSNKVLVENSMGGYEYAIQVLLRTTKNKDPYLEDLHLRATTYIDQNLGLGYKHALRPMKILKYNQKHSTMELLLHLTTSLRPCPDSEYDVVLKSLKKMAADPTSFVLSLIHFSRTDRCMATTSLSNKVTLHWPETAAGNVVLPNEMCLQENGEPVTRRCDEDFMDGARWSKVIGICSDDTSLSETAAELQGLLDRDDLTAKEITGNLSRITNSPETASILEIDLISKILEKLEKLEEGIDVSDLTEIMSNVMDFDQDELRSAQSLLNSTDRMLSSVDNILTKESRDVQNVSVVTSSKLLVQINDVKATNIVGVALKRESSENGDNFDAFTMVPVSDSDNLEDLLNEDDLELAAYLPITITKTERNFPQKLIMSLFYDDSLFNEEETDEQRKTDSRVISVLLPDYELQTKIPVIFKPLHQNDLEKACVHWEYGLDEVTQENLQGRWSKNDEPMGKPSYSVCEFDHTTHFALLMLGSSKDGEISEADAKALDIITAIGTSLSIVSIFLIFVIAFIYKNWRKRSSNKILLNFSAALAMQMVLLFLADVVEDNGVWCKVLGAALHYTVLAQFFWMLVIAVLQYRKFVIVFSNRVPYLVIKACLICWLLPFLPITILILISPDDSYRKNSNGLCYVSEDYFYYGLVVPVAIIVLINLFVFLRIMFAVCYRKIESYGSKESAVKLQIFLAIFLFFLLGISWVFGLATSFGGGIVFSYLFCITATTQGLVLFLFFVVMSEKTKSVWVNMKRNWFRYKTKRRVSNSSCSPTQITD